MQEQLKTAAEIAERENSVCKGKQKREDKEETNVSGVYQHGYLVQMCQQGYQRIESGYYGKINARAYKCFFKKCSDIHIVILSVVYPYIISYIQKISTTIM